MTYNMNEIGNAFKELLSLSEAAEIWRIDESTIRKAIAQGRLVDGEDCRKFGKQWVVTTRGMANAFKIVIGSSNYKWSEFLDKQKQANPLN